MYARFKVGHSGPPSLKLAAGSLFLMLILNLSSWLLPFMQIPNQVSAAPAAPQAPASLEEQATLAYQAMPLYFEQNKGQWANQVQYQARKGNLILQATEQGLELGLFRQKAAKNNYVQPASEFAPENTENITLVQSYNRLLMKLLDSRPNLQAEGREILHGKTNYFVGSEPAQHQTDVNLYSKLVYPAVYPGIDQIIYSNQNGQFQYDFVVAPFADPAQIRLKFEGAEQVELNESGELLLKTSGAVLYQRSLFVYQELGGLKQPVEAKFRIAPDNSVSFELGQYNEALPLIIDPVLIYSTYFGRLESDYIENVIADSEGNLIFSGSTSSKDFPVTANAFQSVVSQGSDNYSDGFIVKLNPKLVGANQLLYVSYFGGNGSDFARKVVLDEQENIIIAGVTTSADLPTTANAWQTAPGTLFIAKLNTNLTGSSQLLYSTYLGTYTPAGSGPQKETLEELILDKSGNLILAGQASPGSALPTTLNAFQKTVDPTPSSNDAYVLKININLAKPNQMLYCTYFGGNAYDSPAGIVLDSANNIVVAGSTGSTDFPITPDAFQKSAFGNYDWQGFILKLNPNLAGASQLVYSTFLGQSNLDSISSIVIDSANNIIVVGSTASTDFPITPDAFQKVAPVSSTDLYAQNGFVAKFDLSKTGTAQLLYASFLGGKEDEDDLHIILDKSENIIIVGGTTASLDFPITAKAFQKNRQGLSRDLFLTKLNLNLAGEKQLIYSTYFGGTDMDYLSSVALDKAGNVLIGAFSYSLNLPITANAYQPKNSEGKSFGLLEGYVAKISLGDETELNLTHSPLTTSPGQAVTFRAQLTPITAGGSVVFTFDGTTNVTTTLNQGVAQYVTNTLSLGNHKVVATYLGQGSFESSFQEITHPVVNPYVVTKISDDGNGITAGTLSYVLAQISASAQPGLVTFNLDGGGNTVTLTGPLLPNVPTATTIDGGAGVIINGNGVSGAGLRLQGRVLLQNLTVRGFGAQEIVMKGGGSRFIHVYIG